MIKRYQSSAGVLTRLADLIGVGLCWWVAYPIRFEWLTWIPFPEAPDPSHYVSLLPLVILLWAFGFQVMGVYRYELVLRRSTEVFTVFRAHLANLVMFTALAYFITQYRFSRGVILVFGTLVLFYSVGIRVLLRKGLRLLNRRGLRSYSMLVVGEGPALDVILIQVERYPELGVSIQKVLGPDQIDSLVLEVAALKPKTVLIALPRNRAAELDRAIRLLKDESVEISIVPDYSDFLALGATVDQFAGMPVVQLQESPLFGIRAWLKRFVDFSLSLVGALLLLPLFFLIMLMIKTTSRGPVFYRQVRMGLDGKTFEMLKFRSMKIDAEESTGAVWAKKDDDRRTIFGAFLRSTSLDELPQLFNVLRGDMSLVGPRPERPVFVERFRGEIPHYMLRHRVKAGITGWAQVNGWRGDTSLEKRIECDLYYIRNWSLWFDLKILFLTIVRGFIHRNAY